MKGPKRGRGCFRVHATMLQTMNLCACAHRFDTWVPVRAVGPAPPWPHRRRRPPIVRGHDHPVVHVVAAGRRKRLARSRREGSRAPPLLLLRLTLLVLELPAAVLFSKRLLFLRRVPLCLCPQSTQIAQRCVLGRGLKCRVNSGTKKPWQSIRPPMQHPLILKQQEKLEIASAPLGGAACLPRA